ncbi:MAG: MFS transporter [Streptosporangiaceae bacterium]
MLLRAGGQSLYSAIPKEVKMRSLTSFARLLSASALSSFGDGVQVVAFPLMGASLTTDPTVIAALAAVGTLPSLIGALPVGGMVDRVRRARLMVAVDLARAAALAVLVVIIMTSHLRLWHLFALAVLLGTGELFFDVSSAALAPAVIPVNGLARFNGYLASTQEACNGLIGPACAGFIYSLSQGAPFAFNGVTFLLSALIISSLARHEPKIASESAGESGGNAVRDLVASVREGSRWLLADRPMLAHAVLCAGWSIFGWIPESVLVLYAKEDLHVSNAVFGVLLSASAAGAVLGGIIAGRVVARFGAAPVLAPCLVLYGAFLLPPAFLSSPFLVGIVFFAQGFPVLVFSVASVTVRQVLVPSAMLGRITSVFYLAGAGLAPVGLLLGGFLGQWTGLRSTFLFGGLGIIVTTLMLARPLTALPTRTISVEPVSAALTGQGGDAAAG